MDRPPADHGSDRYDHVELEWPSWMDGPPAMPDWLTPAWQPCQDCRANAFLRWLVVDGRWHLTVAHDDGCPVLAAHEAGA